MLKASLPASLFAALLCTLAGTTLAQTAPDLAAFESQQLPNLLSTYKTLHSHPELSHHEDHTSATLAEALRTAGYTVTDHVGLYPDGSHAFGVVGLLKNGPGPTLLVRGDMDALPIIEETGVPYASHVLTKNASGIDVGVMHACGHDIHTTVLLGAAQALAHARSQWHGTLMIVGQPSEETIDGAKAMLADHLYDRFGTPTMVIGLHDTSDRAAGTVALTSGPSMASSTSVDVLIHGIGGHGAYPQAGRDPIVLAAMFIVDLQTIVSREQYPQNPSVVTVGDIHGGTKRNIIPNEVKLELTTRAFSDKSRDTTLAGIRQIALGIGTTAGLPPDKLPTVTVLEAESTPVLSNDPALTARVRSTLVQTLGENNVFTGDPVMGSEDVGVFSLNNKIPTCYFRLGAANPARFAAATSAGKPLPGPHTSRFEPDPEPTLATGVKSLTAAAISLLQR